MLSALLFSYVLLFCQAEQCEDESWLLDGGSPPPLDPLCEYDGSLVPDCQLLLSEETPSYYHVHQHGQCQPVLTM